MNAGEGLRGMAQLTDEFIQQQIGFQVYDADTIAYLHASPVPLPEEQQVRLFGIREVTVHVLRAGRASREPAWVGDRPDDL
jgi:hypothetical protein